MKAKPYPVCERCQGVLKPDVVFFGEAIPAAAAAQAGREAAACKVLVIIGTSGVVYPAAEIPFAAQAGGATIVEINVAPTPFTSAITHHFLEGSASAILSALVDALGLSQGVTDRGKALP